MPNVVSFVPPKPPPRPPAAQGLAKLLDGFLLRVPKGEADPELLGPKLRVGAAGFAPPKPKDGFASRTGAGAGAKMLGLEAPPSAPKGDVVLVSLAKPEAAKAEGGALSGASIFDDPPKVVPLVSIVAVTSEASAPVGFVCNIYVSQ